MTRHATAEPAGAVGGDAEPSRLGRPRSKAREDEILAAALHALVTVGFDGMTIEGVAAAAGAGKATLYRRWRNKVDLVVDAITSKVAVHAELDDSGDVRADLTAFLAGMRADLLGPNGALFMTFMAERMRHPELAAAFDASLGSIKRAKVRRRLITAIARGELADDVDVELVAVAGPAIMLYELGQRGGKLPADLPARIVRQLLG